MVQTIGAARTRRLLYAGDRIHAKTAYDWGLVEHLYAPDAVWDATMEMAVSIAGNAPLSIRATKETVADILRAPTDRDPARIHELSMICRKSRDFAEGRAAFREKRAPVFEGR